MFRMPKRKETQYTAPDHRPMIPEFYNPADPAAEAVREARRRREEYLPSMYLKWR